MPNHNDNTIISERIQTPKNDGRSKPRPMTAFKRTQSKNDVGPVSSFDVLPEANQTEINGQDCLISNRPKTAPVISILTAHRRYDSVYPTANKLLAKIWDDAAKKRHLEKLGSMKSKVDNTPPKVYVHLACRFKKTLQQEENNSKIKRENQILEERLRRRLHESKGFSNLNSQFLEGLKVLKQRKRKEDRNRIHQENLNMIQRVEDRKPFYQTKVWEQERKQNLNYLWNISRFPEVYIQSQGNVTKESLKEKIRPKSANPTISHSGTVHTTRSVQLRLDLLKKKESENYRKEKDSPPVRNISSAAT